MAPVWSSLSSGVIAVCEVPVRVLGTYDGVLAAMVPVV